MSATAYPVPETVPVSEAATLTGFSAAAVRKWIAAGEITAYKYRGHELRVGRAEIIELAATKRPTPRYGPKARIVKIAGEPR